MSGARDPPLLRAVFRTVEAYAGKLRLSVDYDGSTATIRAKDHDTGELLGAVHVTKYTTENGREAYGVSAWLAGGVRDERAALVKRLVKKLERELEKVGLLKRRAEKEAEKSA